MLESSEWILKSMRHTRENILYPGVTVKFSDIKYTIVLKRETLVSYHQPTRPNYSFSILNIFSISPTCDNR